MALQVLAAENAKLSPKDVDMVLLVGLSTRMPRVRSLLNEFFGNREHLLSFAVRTCEVGLGHICRREALATKT